MSNRRFRIFHLCSCWLVLAVFFLFDGCSQPGGSSQVEIEDHHIVDDTNDIQYPVVTGLADSTVEASVNAAIRDIVFHFAATTAAEYESIDQSSDPRDPKLEIWGEYTVGANDHGVLSFSFILSWFAGGAHPMSYMRGLTFDLAAGRELTIGDLFADDRYIAGISDVIKEEFEQAEMPLLTEFVSIGPEQEYYLTDEGIAVFFQRYEYTPYAYGFPEFVIPYEQCKSFGLSHEGVLQYVR